MAKLVKSVLGQIGGMASRAVGGGESYEAETEEDRYVRITNSPVGSKLSSSSEEDNHFNGEESFETECPSKRGTLHKWTNYLHGWQARYFVIGEGIFSYYKSEFDTQYGCRGSISLHRVKLLQHEFDELRFDIRAHDCTYFLRATTVEEKEAWVDAIEGNSSYLAERGFATADIRRQGSILSLSGLSQASTSSFKMGHNLQTRLAELETYRDILCKQVDTLQAYFDALAESHSSGQHSTHTTEMNGMCNSVESLDELPEEKLEDRMGEPEETSETPSPPLRQTSDNRRNIPSNTHHSPLPSRFNPPPLKGHRRTGSDPFSFKPHHIHSHVRGLNRTHIHFTLGGSISAASSPGPVDISNIDFRGEAITFKATTAGIQASLAHCIDLMNKREEYWQKKYEKEQERRRKAELAAHSAMNGPRVKAYQYAGPDFEEGPHSTLNEEEFFDALEMAYQNDELETATSSRQDATTDMDSSTATEVDEEALPAAASPSDKIVPKSITGITHRMTPMVDQKVTQYAKYLFDPVDINWNVEHEDGDMKVYRREMEEEGVVVDPLKSYYMANGVSAREMSSYFFDKETRMEWEGTVESFKVVETITEDTIVFHQLHKRIWPATQRETLFCSNLCTLPNAPRPENMVGNTWMVCNFSIDHPDVPPTSKLIRATMHVGMVCQTIVSKPVEPGQEAELTRDDIHCKCIYAANVNPGGWAPPSVVRTIGKRELCKFLRKFSATVQRHTLSTPLTL